MVSLVSYYRPDDSIQEREVVVVNSSSMEISNQEKITSLLVIVDTDFSNTVNSATSNI